MSSNIPLAPQGNVPAIGIPDSQDIPRLVFSAPYFEQVPLAELIEPSVIEAVEAALPALVPPYVDAAAQAAVQAQAVLLVGSTMTGPLFLSPLMPTQPSQAATMAYVDSMIATAGIPEVPPVPSGQVWARETGQWVPITPQTGVFLPLAGGSMVGNINMSGNTIQNMAAVPAMPNGAAPAQWVLNQIASVSLFQGQWDADTNVPDLTQLSVRVNGYTWIAITTAPGGVVVGPAIPGLQGKTVFNGDTIYYSTVDGAFFAIHAGGLTLPEAQSLFVLLAGSQMSGPLLLNANASQPLQAVTYQQLQTFVPPGAVTEAPNDGQLYGRNGLTASWAPVLPLAGGILTGALTLFGNATANLNPVPLQQMTSAISAATAGLLPLAGGAMTGLMTLSGNASVALNPVPLQQLNSMLGTYAPLQNPAFSGVPTVPTATPPSTNTTQAASTAFVQSVAANYLPLTGGTLSGPGNLAVSGTLEIGTAGTFYLQQASFGPLINWSPGWFDLWRPATGVREWDGPSGVLMTLDASGDLHTTGAISTAGAFSITAGGGLFAGGTTTGPGLYPGGAGVVLQWSSQWNDQWNSTNGVRTWNGPSGAVMTLDGVGNLTVVSLTQTSDEANKTNIEPIAQGISLVRRLIPKSFAFKGTPDRLQWGFIAQDVQPVIPPAVVETDMGGSGSTLLGFDVTAVVAALTYAMQQADSRLTALENAAGVTPPADALA